MARFLVTIWALGCAGYGAYSARQCYLDDELSPCAVVFLFFVGSFFAFLVSGSVVGTVVTVFQLLTGQLGGMGIDD